MRFKLSAVVANIVVLLVEIASPAFGQGNLTGFDTEKSVTLHGTVNRVEWINPNTWIHVALKTANGAKEDWRIAAGSPNILLRRGLTKESLKTGYRDCCRSLSSQEWIFDGKWPGPHAA